MKDVQIFLIDLDSLFDTRLGTLYSHSREVAENNLTIGYFDRKLDDFIGLPFEEFKELYEKRDKQTLQVSLVTPMLDILLEFVAGVYKNGINGFETKKPKILLNIYPYNLLEDEQKVIQEMLISLTKGFCLIELVYLTLEQITPMYIRDHIDAMSMYNYTDWIECHSVNENLKKVSSPGTAIFGPRLHFKRMTQDEKNFLAMHKLNPFEVLETNSAPLFALKTLQPSFYCANLLEQAQMNAENEAAKEEKPT